MAANPVPGVLARLSREAEGESSDSDGALLARFVKSGDEAAFAVLVQRHAPMVLAVCLRILGNYTDAEDACQAVFLLLVRRAHVVRPPGLVGGWLHGVARNIARRARRAAARRARHEELARTAGPRTEPDPDLRSAIDQELDRLPADLRAAVLTCDLQGHTRSEAARRLGWAEGTVASRLARGRRRLAAGLRRAGLGAALAVPAGTVKLRAEQITAIVEIGLGRRAAGPAAQNLTHGALRAMTLKRVLLSTALLCGLGSVGLFGRLAVPAADARTPLPVLRQIDPAVPVKEPEGGLTVKTAPPVVVKTVPAAGAADVDPSLGEIRVTFSKEMTDGSWSWTQLSDDSFPKPRGDSPVAYDKDKRTCVMKVNLEAGRTYAIWLNSEKFTNFKDADGRSAVPYLLVFQTKRVD